MSATAVTTRYRIGSLEFYYPAPDDPVWQVIDAQFAARGLDTPARTSRLAVAEDADGCVSFFMLQALLHAEPMFIHPAHRSVSSVLPNLIAMMQTWIEAVVARGMEVYIVADTAATVDMCEWYGMERVESPVYRRAIRARKEGDA
jgi:hypothetical protein